MAYTATNWIPVEIDGPQVKKWNNTSAIERVATGVPMKSDTKEVPVQGSFTVGGKAKGAAYVTDSGTAAVVELKARMIGATRALNNEDLNDSGYSLVESSETEGAHDLAVYLDNACLGVSAAQNFASNNDLPFDSVYRVVSQYNSASNLVASSALTYAQVNSLFGLVALSQFNDIDDQVIIAHPKFQSLIQGITSSAGTPIFNYALGVEGKVQDLIMGVPVIWTNGARKSAVAASAPAGAPLFIVTSRKVLLRGDARLNGTTTTLPGTAFQGNSGAGFFTEQSFIKVGVRRGFAVADAASCAVLEYTGA